MERKFTRGHEVVERIGKPGEGAVEKRLGLRRYVSRFGQVVVPGLRGAKEEIRRSFVNLVVVVLLHNQARSQGLFENRVLLLEQFFADLPLVELRVQLVDFGLVLFANCQVFFQALAQLVPGTKAGKRRVETFLRLLQLRRLVLLERG
ncbi:hypothetical protein D3C86_1482080 [compost metagenome]